MRGVPILTAVSDAVWEAELVAAFERGDLGIVVVRRCVDLAELLAVAATRTARAVLLSADLRRLDGEVVSRLSAMGLAVLGIAESADEVTQRFLYQCGVPVVLPASAAATEVADAIVGAVGGRADGRPAAAARGAVAYGDPSRALPDLVDLTETHPPRALVPPPRPPGRVIAVWGPTGAPGRTSVALGVADELAAAGMPTMLVDADTYGGAVGQLLGVLDEAPGLMASVRAAIRAGLDVAGLAALARDVGGLRVLTGVLRTDRWPELPVDAFVRVLDLARQLVELVVIDCGFCLEQDEELAYDTLAPRRNGLTLAALAEADIVLAVGAADPVGLQRLIRGLDELRTTVPDVVEPRIVVTRVRRGPVPGDPVAEVTKAVRRHLGVEPTALIPDDRAAYDLATRRARSLREVAPASPARNALVVLAQLLRAECGADRDAEHVDRASRSVAGSPA